MANTPAKTPSGDPSQSATTDGASSDAAGMPRFKVTHKFARITARKCRLVADLIRGKSVNESLELLTYLHKRGARLIEKLLNSSVANASNQGFLDVANLFVSEIHVDPGPTLKRWRPRAKGRACKLLKRTSHIRLAVSPRS